MVEAVSAARIGEHVGLRDLRYDEELRSFVYPVRAGWIKDEERGTWIGRCLRVHIYDTRRSCWYGSEIKETLDRYARVGVGCKDPDTLDVDALHQGETGHASADGEALDAREPRERWSALLWR